MAQQHDIDFVIAWVDGSDPAWAAQMAQYREQAGLAAKAGAADRRYRDWGSLRYWFRGVEANAPWVRTIHFVTWGHVPEWLNLDNPKLHIVRHEDYIPEKYLPTFSSHPIELNFHRIEGLAEHFVYFNDDMYLMGAATPETYFRDGLPVYAPVLHPIVPMRGNNMMSHIYVNMGTVINTQFDKAEQMAAGKSLWMSPFKCGLKTALSNRIYNMHKSYVGFGNQHMPAPLRVSTMQAVWDAVPEVMDDTCCRKFRSAQDVSQYLFRYWELASGTFSPIKAADLGRRFEVGTPANAQAVANAIRSKRYLQLCINDIDNLSSDEELEQMMALVNGAFESVFPEPSSFEKAGA